MSDVPNKPEQVADTNTNKCENDYGQASSLYFFGLFLISLQDVCDGDILSKAEVVVSAIGVYDDVQQSPSESIKTYALNTEKPKHMLLPSSPSSTANVALPPLSSIPVPATDCTTNVEDGELVSLWPSRFLGPL